MTQIQMQDKLTAKFLEVLNGNRRMYSAHMAKVYGAGVREFEAKGYSNMEAHQLVKDAQFMAHLAYNAI